MQVENKKLACLINGYVTVKISENRFFNGILSNFDENLNIVLKDSEDHKIINGNEEVTEVGLIFLRGSCIIGIFAKDIPSIKPKLNKESRYQIGTGKVSTFSRTNG